MARTSIHVDDLMGAVSTLDERLFGDNTLSIRLFKSYILMAVLVFMLPPLLDALFLHTGISTIFYYITLPIIGFAIILFFIYWSITQLVSPLREMAIALRRIETGDIGIELNMTGYVEIDHLRQAVERMRNSLMIAERYLGHRETKKDGRILGSILQMHIPMLLLVTYLVYGALVISIGSIVYTPVVQEVFSALPFPRVMLALFMILVGTGFAAGLGYLTSILIGKPIRKLTIVAEEASLGNFNVKFPTMVKGEIAEMSQHLRDITDALERAYKELESEGE